MTETEVFVINFLICIGFGVGGFLLRITLEAWRDYHVQKALYEAHLQDTNPVRRYRQEESSERRYRRAQHRQRTVPRDVLTKFLATLRRNKRAAMTRIDGRWKNAA